MDLCIVQAQITSYQGLYNQTGVVQRMLGNQPEGLHLGWDHESILAEQETTCSGIVVNKGRIKDNSFSDL